MNEKTLAGLAISLFILWLILSGEFNIQFITLGVISVLLVIYLTRKFLLSSNFNLYNQINFLKLVFFVPSMIIEIFKSNIDVLKLIINKKISPQLVTIKNTTKTPSGEYILSLCITLTPGSLILEYNEEELLIHVMDDHIKDSVVSLHINKIVSTLEYKSKK